MTTPLLLATMTLLATAAGAAQEPGRSLHWEAVEVDAQLDAEGRLHVRERQVMVFDGAWNGGERVFDVRAGQRLRITGVARTDPRTGEPIPLTEDDDLDDVGDYDVDDGRVRWRARLEDDPPFDGERIGWVLDYTLDNAVRPVGGGGGGGAGDGAGAGPGTWLLDYDFLFPDRDAPVERFALTLALDSAWAPAGSAIPGRWEAGPVPPGRGFAVRIPLRYAGDDRPATIPAPPPAGLRLALVVLLLGGAAALALRFLARERAAGRFDPLPDVDGAAWLEAHVLRYPPELVGAAWDGSTAAPEVAGLLARLVQEEKLASRVEPGDDAEPVLHLELLVPRDAFDDTERPLIDALFFDGRTRTDTATVRDHYQESGFDPAHTIAPALAKRVAALPGAGRRPADAIPAALGLLAALALLLAAAIARHADAPAAGLAFLFALAAGLPAIAFAATYAAAVTRLRGLAITFLAFSAVLVVGFALFIGGVFETTDPESALSPYYRAGPLLLTALAALGISLVALTIRLGRPRESPERLDLRRRLAAGRAWLADQLRRPDPELRDAWFPWLLALGLGPHVDRWFQSHGPAAPGTRGGADGTTGMLAARTALMARGGPAAAGAGGGGGGGAGGWTGGGPAFGGGGGFAGGGVGASWGVAAAAVASGVAAPSSGTAGGVASAGGGGGGGW